jgi:hypothetical protein
MPCPPQVPISVIPPVGAGVGPLVYANGNQIARLNPPLNPSFVVYDGSVTRWGDGSLQAPVLLPNLQQVVSSSINFYVGLNTSGQLAAFANTTINPNEALVTATGTTAARTLANRFADSVNIKDFGAVGDGITNDTLAFEALVTYCAAEGVDGFIPSGTYLIDPSSRTFSSNNPFSIFGEGNSSSILKNRNTSSSFIYWFNANNVSFESLKIDASFTGLPSEPPSGGTLVFVNSNNNTLRNVDFINIYRVALLIYNDHQTTLTNVYGGHVIDSCRVFGPSNLINNVGPSAFLLADVNNSTISNCYIKNIGLYGYEFKNDCNNTIISNCISEDVYYPLYYGGDGVHTELGYVKNSLIEGCIVRRALSGAAVAIGRASNNTIRNIQIDQTGVTTVNYSIFVGTSNNNSITGIDLKNRTYYAVSIRDTSSYNNVEFSNITDGTNVIRGIYSIANDCVGNLVVFGTRDSTNRMFLDSYSLNLNNNTIIDQKYNIENYATSVSALKRIRFGDCGVDSIAGSAKGLAIIGDTADYYQTTNQDSTYQNFGNFSNSIIATIRYRLTDGTKFENLYNGSAYATYITSSNGFFPNENNVRKLGDTSNKWSSINVTKVLTGLASTTSYANDTDAAAGGVAVGQLYRNGSVVQVRVT